MFCRPIIMLKLHVYDSVDISLITNDFSKGYGFFIIFGVVYIVYRQIWNLKVLTLGLLMSSCINLNILECKFHKNSENLIKKYQVLI